MLALGFNSRLGELYSTKQIRFVPGMVGFLLSHLRFRDDKTSLGGGGEDRRKKRLGIFKYVGTHGRKNKRGTDFVLPASHFAFHRV